MNCYYQVNDGEWVKGDMSTCGGTKDIQFENSKGEIYRIFNPEFLFGDYLSITGYERITESDKSFKYKITFVDVKFEK